MRAVDTTRNRPRRWSPTRALLWEHSRTRGMLAAMACVLSWLLILAVPFASGGFALSTLSVVCYFVGMVWLVLGLLLIDGKPNAASSQSWPFLSHVTRLPVNSVHTVFIHYTASLAWVLLFVAPFGIVWAIAESSSIPSRFLPFTVIMFVLLHILVWASRIRYLLVLLVPIAAVSVLANAYHLFSYSLALWCAVAVCVAISGYFILWGIYVLYRGDHGFSFPWAFSLPQRQITVPSIPFTSALRAQLWFEFHHYRLFVLGSFVAFPILAGILWLVLDPLKSDTEHFLNSMYLLRFTVLYFLLLVAIFAGLAVPGRPDVSYHVFFFARPAGTFRLALARLLALGCVACALLVIAGIVEAAYRIGLHSAGEQSAPAFTAAAADAEQSYAGTSVNTMSSRAGSEGSKRVTVMDSFWPENVRLWGAIGFVVIIWCCMTSPVLSMFLFHLGGTMRTLIMMQHSSLAPWYPAGLGLFALGILAAHVFSARRCAREGLVPRAALTRTGVMTVAAGVVFFVGFAGFGSNVEYGTLMVTVVLLSVLPFTCLPWRLYRQRHR